MPLDPLFEKMLSNARHVTNAKGEQFLQFRCQYHGYDVGEFSAPPVHQNCEQCWWLYFMKLQDVTDPKKRGEIADRLAQVIANADQEVREGRWDYIPLSKPRLVQVDGDTDLHLN